MTDPGSDVSPSVARLVADAADAFQARRARGEDPDPEEYAARHPEAADAIRGVLNVLRWAPVARPAPADDPPPRMLGDFRVGREVGRGGMGIVYEAEQLSLGRRVALKVLPYAALVEPRLLQRFHNEARAAAGLDHPHVVKVYAVGQDRGVHFIAMQFIDGRPLSDLIQAVHAADTPGPGAGTSASLPSTDPVARATTAPDHRSAAFVRRAVELGVQAADGLEHAHSLGVVHRDVKPANLLLDQTGSLWVSDFGLAKMAAADPGVTGTGDVFGTLRYMSPEQAQAKHDLVDHRTDVYALGATLYELLTGRPAADGADKVALLRQITDADPAPVRRLNRAVPADLETVVHKCLRKEPNDRYGSAQEVADDLRRFVRGEPVRARPTGPLGRLARWRRRNRGLAAALAVAAVALLGVTAVSAGWAVRERDNARDLGAALDRAEYRLAENYLDQGVWRCETGDVRAGLLWLARALEKAPPGADRLQETIRMQLAGWWADVPPLVAAVDCPGPITAAALSPDGKTAWMAGQDRVVRRWDVERGELTEGPTLPEIARQLLWNPDGKIVVSVGHRGVVNRWEVGTGRVLGPPLASGVWAAAWAADGTFLVTGDANGRVRRWDGQTGEELGPAIRQVGEVKGIAVSPDGRTVLTTDDKVAQFWEVATGRRSGEPLPHAGKVTSVAYGPEGGPVLTVTDEQHIRAWGATDRRPLGNGVGYRQLITGIAFDPAGRRYLAWGHQRAVRPREWTTGEPRGPAVNHPAAVEAVSYSRDGELLLTASTDGSVRMWGATPRAEPTLVLRHASNVTSATFGPDGHWVLTGSFDRTAQVRDAATGRVIGEPMKHPKWVLAVALNADGSQALTVCWDGLVRRWDTVTGQERGAAFGHTNCRVLRAEFSPDGATILTGDADGRVSFWDVETGAERARANAHRGAVSAVATCPGRGWVATAGEDGRIWLWNPTTGQPAGPDCLHGAVVHALAFDRTGSLLASGGEDHRVRVWETTTGQQPGSPLEHGSGIWTAAFSPDGQTILTGSDDGTARLWELPAGQPRGRPLNHQDRVWVGAFSPDGKTAVTGSRDGTARLWDVETGKPLGPPLTHGAQVCNATFSPDGRRILTGSHDGTARLWPVPVPTTGSAGDIRRSVEVLSGLGLDDDDASRVLGAAAWQARQRELVGSSRSPR